MCVSVFVSLTGWYQEGLLAVGAQFEPSLTMSAGRRRESPRTPVWLATSGRRALIGPFALPIMSARPTWAAETCSTNHSMRDSELCPVRQEAV